MKHFDYMKVAPAQRQDATHWLMAVVLVIALVLMLTLLDARTAHAQRTVCRLSQSQDTAQQVCRATKTTTVAQRAAKRAAEGRTASRVRRWGR